MGYFALISDITSSLFRPGSTQERSPGGREADTGCERFRFAGEMQRKIVRKMPRLFTPNWTSAAFRHRLSSTSLKGWAVYALSESP